MVQQYNYPGLKCSKGFVAKFGSICNKNRGRRWWEKPDIWGNVYKIFLCSSTLRNQFYSFENLFPTCYWWWDAIKFDLQGSLYNFLDNNRKPWDTTSCLLLQSIWIPSDNINNVLKLLSPYITTIDRKISVINNKGNAFVSAINDLNFHKEAFHCC